MSPSPTTTARPAQASATRTFDNAVLGYRMTFPATYRRSWSRIFTGSETLGSEYFTVQTEAEAKAECLQDGGDAGALGKGLESDVLVSVFLNTAGASPATFAATPRCAGCDAPSKFHTIEPTTIGGNEAVRLAWEQTRETDQLIVKAGDRLYQIGPVRSSLPSSLPKGWLDAIAATFVAVTPAALPTPTPTIAPRVAVAATAQALRTGFTSRDADAVMRLAAPCWLNVWGVIDEMPLGGGVLWRSVPDFTQGLRDRFAAGTLTVQIDPTVQQDTSMGPDVYYVRALWKDADWTSRVDLIINGVDGQWLWTGARHHRSLSDSDMSAPCWGLRYPWVAKTGRC